MRRRAGLQHDVFLKSTTLNCLSVNFDDESDHFLKKTCLRAFSEFQLHPELSFKSFQYKVYILSRPGLTRRWLGIRLVCWGRINVWSIINISSVINTRWVINVRRAFIIRSIIIIWIPLTEFSQKCTAYVPKIGRQYPKRFQRGVRWRKFAHSLRKYINTTEATQRFC